MQTTPPRLTVMADGYVPQYHPSKPGEAAPESVAAARKGLFASRPSSSQAPEISGESKVVTSRGSPTTLLCHVSGDPSPVVEWLHAGEPCGAEGGKYGVIKDPPYYCLLVEDTCSEVAGEYCIKAVNKHGESAHTIQVSVLTPAEPESKL